MPHLQVLVEAPEAAATADRPALTGRLAQFHGGDLRLPRDLVYANFVTSIDGVADLDAGEASVGSVISGRNPADRWLMGILRALADAILVGAGTVLAEGAHLWRPETTAPELASELAELRRRLGLTGEPRLVIASGSGRVAGAARMRAIEHGALVLTDASHQARLRAALPASCRVAGLESLDAGPILAAIRAEGHRRVLCEGGPHLLGRLAARGAVEELFLSLAPVLAGRDRSPRPGLIAGQELLPTWRDRWRLLSVRADRSMLFLRYRREALASPGSPEANV